jgi:hypothetical protein
MWRLKKLHQNLKDLQIPQQTSEKPKNRIEYFLEILRHQACDNICNI